MSSDDSGLGRSNDQTQGSHTRSQTPNPYQRSKNRLYYNKNHVNSNPSFPFTHPSIRITISEFFAQQKPKVVPTGPPKNIKELTRLSEPVPRLINKKYKTEEEEEIAQMKKQWKIHEQISTVQPKNLEKLTKLALPRFQTPKFTEEKIVDTLKKVRNRPPPSNVEFLNRLAAPLPRNKTKKYSTILEEEAQEEQMRKMGKKPVSAGSHPKPQTHKAEPAQSNGNNDQHQDEAHDNAEMNGDQNGE